MTRATRQVVFGGKMALSAQLGEFRRLFEQKLDEALAKQKATNTVFMSEEEYYCATEPMLKPF